MLTRRFTCSLVVAALMLAGCHDGGDSFSQAVQHAPSTPPPSSQVSAVETTAAPTREVSLRPREIRFDEDTKPCDLLLPSQVDRLAGDQRKRTPGTERTWRSPTCHFGGPTRTWSVTTVTETGVEFRFDVHKLYGQLQVNSAYPIALGFPVYSAVDPAREAVSCYLAIDTAKEQMLVIGIELTPPVNKRLPCTEARPIAEEAMRTLIT
ncbi:uncharacterized protein DUF3558 [Lentzea atacamensis]|uniref:Uncharacterized protein DUF3558 n=1 Tax=Lentzea atacamensis TaxID=531938 RepID=A0ABX9DW74_9PSEU|nr:DUF3558 domain-containing protein [Lentzea atacamensis]RAS59534.1 uncharacterized protein DUF3558 [Lentzea atacamensis]